ncbi:MAG: arsenate reductase (glutaredoxin) [Parvibaculum sp.]
MAKPVIYHNPRCSKSRETLALLEARGLDPLIVDYLKAPPSAVELQTILKKLKMKPRDLLRKGEAVYKELGLDDGKLTDEKLIRAMIDNPILIERPIVVMGAKAKIGRPPESVLDIL